MQNLNVIKESYRQRITNLIILVTLELDEEAKEVLEYVRDKCNEILKDLKPTEESIDA